MKTAKRALVAASSIAVLLALGACGERETTLDERADNAATRTEQAANEAKEETSQAANEAKEEANQAGSTVMGAGSMMDDATIVTKVKSQLAADDEIKALAIDVDAKDGMVTLTGTVPNDAAKDRAADIVKNTEGIKGLDNQLVVKA
jgi:hyperosmotically inducible protein